ncbi:hypothetical protein SAMN02910358_00062 [Lachnospiraceae bacterium XBB1006]|nr:hypothetical protein SAMN02910358_00062 [Lachnospiraceae bacterium XBB1006]
MDEREIDETLEQDATLEQDNEEKEEKKTEVNMLKTKSVPSICMLLAGLVRCVFGILHQDEIKGFLWSLVLVMILFYLIGIAVRIIIDRNFKVMIEDASPEKGEKEKELENIDGEVAELGEGGTIQEKLSEQLGDDDNSESFE